MNFLLYLPSDPAIEITDPDQGNDTSIDPTIKTPHKNQDQRAKQLIVKKNTAISTWSGIGRFYLHFCPRIEFERR